VTDLIYSATLLAAVVLAAAAALCGLALVLTGNRRQEPFVTWLGAAATAFGVASLLVHFRFGHHPDSPEPMALTVFITHHPAYLGVAGLVFLAASLRLLNARRRRQ